MRIKILMMSILLAILASCNSNSELPTSGFAWDTEETYQGSDGTFKVQLEKNTKLENVAGNKIVTFRANIEYKPYGGAESQFTRKYNDIFEMNCTKNLAVKTDINEKYYFGDKLIKTDLRKERVTLTSPEMEDLGPILTKVCQ